MTPDDVMLERARRLIGQLRLSSGASTENVIATELRAIRREAQEEDAQIAHNMSARELTAISASCYHDVERKIRALIEKEK